MQRWYLAIRELVHQHKSAVHKISEDRNQFTVDPVLEIFPGKIIVFGLRHIAAKHIAENILLTGKIIYIIMYPYRPVAARGNFFTFNIEKLVGRHIIG